VIVLMFCSWSCQLPQQENSFDCGLFLLHYLELFLVEAPVNFSPFRINGFTKFVSSIHQLLI
jgi:sentrin-specific protease 7